MRIVMYVPPSGSLESPVSAEALLTAAHDAATLLGDRSATAGIALARPPAYGIDDEMRARAGLLIAEAIGSAEIALAGGGNRAR